MISISVKLAPPTVSLAGRGRRRCPGAAARTRRSSSAAGGQRRRRGRADARRPRASACGGTSVDVMQRHRLLCPGPWSPARVSGEQRPEGRAARQVQLTGHRHVASRIRQVTIAVTAGRLTGPDAPAHPVRDGAPAASGRADALQRLHQQLDDQREQRRRASRPPTTCGLVLAAEAGGDDPAEPAGRRPARRSSPSRRPARRPAARRSSAAATASGSSTRRSTCQPVIPMPRAASTRRGRPRACRRRCW